MKKYMNLKRILSLLLAVVLLAGTVSAFGYGYAKASQSEYNEVTLTLNVEDSSPTGLYLGATITDGPDKGKSIKDAYGEWTSAAEAAVLCDGESKYVAFSSAGLCLYLNADPSIDKYTDIVIPKGLVLPMADTSTGDLKTPIKINNRVKLVNNGGRWSQEQEPEKNYVEITYENMDVNTLYLKGTLVDGPNAGEMIGGQTEGYGDWGLNTTATIYVNGTTPLEVFFGTASDFLYIQGLSGAVLTDYTSIDIKKDTVLTPAAGNICMIPLVIKNDLSLEKKNGNWQVKQEAAEGPEVVTDISITGYEMYPNEEQDFCQLILRTDINLNTTYPYAVFKGEITIGDTKKTVDWNIEDNLMYTIGITYDEYTKADKLLVAKDTIFTLSVQDKKKLNLTNSLDLVKQENVWFSAEAKIHKYEINDFEHYRIADQNFHQLILKFTDDIRKTTLLSMKGYVYLDGNAKEIEWHIDPEHGLFYTVGITLDEGDKAKTIEIKKDSIFTLIGDTQNVICMSKGITIENKDGDWAVKNDPTEKEVVTDVKVTEYEMYPKQEEGFCQIILHTDKNLNKDYPSGTFAGEITIGNTKKTVEWYAGDNILYTVGITYQEYLQADKLSVTQNATFVLFTNNLKKIRFTNGLNLEKKSGLWMNADAKAHKYEVKDFEMYRVEEKKYYQLILKLDGDIRKTTIMPITGTVYLDGKAKEVEWYVDELNGLFYTVGISLEEGDKAKKIEIAADSFLTILNDTKNVIYIPKAFKLVKFDGIWMKDEGQSKVEYNEVKLSYSSCDGKGFYLKAEIVAGPDKGKTIGSSSVYGDWLSSAAGTMTYDKNKSMDVWFSPSGDMIYVSGDYDLTKIKNITFKKDTVLTPIAGAKYSVMMKLANTIELAKDTRYDRWVLAKDVNKKYDFNDVTVGVTRVTGAVLEMKGSFKKNNSKVLKDVYGDWVNLNGPITLGDPAKGKYTENGATWSLAGDMLMLYGISAGLMDSIQIKAGTVLWPDASCKTQTPIRITNDVVMKRNTEDEWVISKGAYVAGATDTGTTEGTTENTVVSGGTTTTENAIATLKGKDATVRLVEQGSNTKELVSSTIAVESQDNQMVLYIAIGAVCIVLGALAILWIVIGKKRKAKSKREDG